MVHFSRLYRDHDPPIRRVAGSLGQSCAGWDDPPAGRGYFLDVNQLDEPDHPTAVALTG